MKSSSKSNRFKQRIKQAQLFGAGFFLFEDPHDLYYLTGVQLSKGCLILSDKAACLFVDKRYKEAAENAFAFEVRNLNDADIKEFIQQGSAQTLFFDPGKISYQRHQFFKNLLDSLGVAFKEGDPFLNKQRAIKDAKEIEAISRSANLLQECMQYIQSQLVLGVTETEVAKAFEIYALQKGASGLSFQTIVAFSENSAKPHHKCSDRSLKDSDFVLIDAGLMVDHYASDMTRVFLLNNKDPKVQKIYDVVYQTYQEVLSCIQAGVKVSELDQLAHKIAKQHGFEAIHALGHGVGLEVHEYPRMSQSSPPSCVLEEGMVITVEPGIYVTSLGGVRYEDMLLVTKTGYKNFYKKAEVC